MKLVIIILSDVCYVLITNDGGILSRLDGGIIQRIMNPLWHDMLLFSLFFNIVKDIWNRCPFLLRNRGVIILPRVLCDSRAGRAIVARLFIKIIIIHCLGLIILLINISF